MLKQVVDEKLSNRMTNMSFVAALLVVSIHVGVPSAELISESLAWSFGLIKSGVARIAVPWFFLAAGFFIMNGYGEEGWFSRCLKRRVRSLTIPYLVWNVIVALQVYLFYRCGLSHYQWPHDSIWPVLGRITGLTSFWPFYDPLWFLRALMLLVLLSPLLVYLARNKWLWGGFYLLAWFSPLLCESLELTERFFYAVIPLEGLSYFLLGMVLRIHGIPAVFLEGRKRYIALFALGMILFALVHRPGWVVLRWPAMTLGMIGIWGIVPGVRWPRWLTTSAFPIYLLHMWLNGNLMAILKRLNLWGWDCQTIIQYLLTILVVATLAMVVTFFLRRCSPRCAEVLFGGR